MRIYLECRGEDRSAELTAEALAFSDGSVKKNNISCKNQKSSVADKRQEITILFIKPKIMSNLSGVLDILTR